MKTLLIAIILIFATALLSADVTISTIFPAAGLTRGGEYVHLHGTNLVGVPLACPAVTCSEYVQFGDAFGTILDVTETEIVVLAPAHAPGPVDLHVNVPPGPPVTIACGYSYQEAQAGDQIRVLVPIAISAAGALSTHWKTDLFIYNGNSEPLLLAGATVLTGSSPPRVSAFSTLAVNFTPPPANTGAFLYIPRRLVDNVAATLRVHDDTRDGQSWGTEIPLVPETQFRRSVMLLGIPTDPRFRTLLRAYSYAPSDAMVLVALRDDATNELLDSRTVSLRSGLSGGTDAPAAPSYGQLALDPLLLPFGTSHPRVRAEVTAISPAPSIWAFVSITDNVTQEVTTSTPLNVLAPLTIATPTALAQGHWAGGGACVDVSATTVTVVTQCAGGVLPPPAIGPDGHFEIDGTYAFSVGPANPVPGYPAHFSGVLQGTSLTLTIRFRDTTIGPVTVQFGSTADCQYLCP